MYSVYSVQKRKVSSKCFYIVPILNITCDIVYSLFFNLCYFFRTCHRLENLHLEWVCQWSTGSQPSSWSSSSVKHLTAPGLYSNLAPGLCLPSQGSVALLVFRHRCGSRWFVETKNDFRYNKPWTAWPARILQLEQVFHTLNFRGLGIQSLLRSKCYAFVGLQKAWAWRWLNASFFPQVIVLFSIE